MAWEYKIERMDMGYRSLEPSGDQAAMDALTAFGADGWELVAMDDNGRRDLGGAKYQVVLRFFFKRKCE